jgi:copper(I)-binding protein
MPEGKVARSRTRGVAGSITGLLVFALAITGCAQGSAAATPIKVGSAYVMQANGDKTLSGYLVIANSGPTDQLLAVRSSAGGQVLMVGSPRQGVATTAALREFVVRGHHVTKFDPNGRHLEIVHSGRLHVGTDITLTLVFAHAGTMHILAQVSNPQTSNSGYFGP